MRIAVCRKTRSYALIVVVCWLSVVSMAQQLSFDHLTIDQGLSGNTVYAIVQDQDGFLWFGSRYGLNRYDGTSCRVYNSIPGDSLSLFDDHVQALYCDAFGNIWVGLQRGGVNVYDRVRQVFIRDPFNGALQVDVTELSVDAFFEDSRGFLWFGTLGQGVFAYHPELDSVLHFHTQHPNPSYRLSFDHAFSFVEDADGTIWIGTSGGEIDSYDPAEDEVRQLFYPEGSKYNLGSYKKALHLEGDTLWIGTEGNGVHYYHLRDRQFIGSILPGKLITDISRDSLGDVWIATDGDGLYTCDMGGRELEHYTYSGNLQNSLNTNALYCIYTDRQHNVWIGTFNGGVNAYKPGKMEFLTFLQSGSRAEAPGFQSVLTLYEDSNNTVWIGTDGGGLVRFDRESQTFDTYRSRTGDLGSDVITSIYQDSNGVFWLGTYANGLLRFNSESRTYRQFMNDIQQPGTIANNNVWAISSAGPGELWIGTLGGGLDLFNIETEQFRHFGSLKTEEGNRLDLNIRTLLPEPDGSLWIGTEYGGLYHLGSDRRLIRQWNGSDKPNELELASETVLSLFKDSGGSLWVGTEGGGLHNLRRDGSGFIRYGISEGLPSDVVNAIREDEFGRIWVSTNAGLSVLDPMTGAVTSFDKNDGLQSNSFNPNASLTASDGELYFGGLSGMNVFSPGKLPINSNPPQVAFTELKIFNAPVAATLFQQDREVPLALNDEPTLELERSENVFTIEFAALEFTNSARNSLAYRLVGFESDWTFVPGNRHAVTYTNLDYGRYLFEVKGANNSGLWSSDVRRLKLVIKPAFYETLWFQVLIFLLVVGVIVGYVRYARHLREEAYQRELLKAREETLKLRNEHLAQEIREKNGRLSAALLQSAHKNNSLDDLKKELNELLRQDGQEATRRKELKTLIRRIDSEIDTEDYWEQFQLNFDQVHREYSRKLLDTHPNISVNDVRLCCLMKIGLTNREIASIQSISLSGVEKSKYRLKKKLELDKEEDLNTYLLKFE